MVPAAIVLGLTALGGLVLAFIRFSGAPRPPTWLALGHGALGATGLALLIYAVATHSYSNTVYVALGVFLVAAAGGIIMFVGFHLREKPLPKLLVVLHGLIAAIGLVLLATQFGIP